MKKRRAFILNSTVILLLIPLMLLLATYEDVSSQIILSQSERTQVERTYRIVSYVEMDFQRALEISGKRAVVTIVDYIANTRDFLDPDNPNGMANATIRDLALFGSSTEIASNYSERLMRDQTILGWLGNISTKLETQGYVLKISNHTLEEIASMDATSRANFLRSYVKLTVAPLDAFRIVIKARILEAEIEEVSGKMVYAGPIPREGYVYSIISVENLEDPLFSALSFGRYYRSIKACEYPYPEIIDRPLKVLYGNGSSEESHVLGKYSSSQVSAGYIFYGDYYPGSGADGYVLSRGDITGISDPVIVNTTLRGVPVSPLDVFSDNDIGVLVFGNTTVETQWCDMNYKWRVNITIPSFPDGSAVLLKVPVSLFPNIYHEEGRASLKIYQKSESSCTQVPFWIEYWGTSYAWIWIQAQGEDYTIYFTDDPGYAIDGYRKEDIFWLIDTFDGPDIDLIKWQNLGGAYIDSGHLVVPGGVRKLALRTVDSISGEFFIRFRMMPSDQALDFDSGVSVEYPSNILRVDVTYSSPLPDPTEIQVPITLSASETAGINADPTTNQAEIEVYSDESLQHALPFWIEYWNSTGAKIWIKTNLTPSGSGYTTTVYIRYNTGTLTRGDGRAVFEFFEDFENPSEWALWTDHNNGYLSITDTYVHDGDYAIAKYGYNDPNGGYRDIGKTLGRDIILEYWDYRINTNGGKLDRVGLIDENGDGYGAILRANNGKVGVDVRDDYNGDSKIGSFSSSSPGIRNWYFVRFIVRSDGTLRTEVYDENMNILGSYTRIDFSYSTFTRVYIFGGHDYAIDDIRIRKYLDEDLVDVSVSPIPSTIQFIDDNAGFEDHGGDTLAILENWGTSTVSGTPTTLAEYHRYEVRLTSDGSSTELEFEDVDTPFRTVSSSVDGDILENTKIGISTDGSTDAYFDWIIIGGLPYYSAESSDIQASNVESAPSESTSPYNARAYDLQPFIQCIIDQKYFGTYNGISFFERLEDSRKNHAEYFELAKQIQDELGLKYGDKYYPIGLVSFMVPHADYDRKLFNIFDNFGIPIKEGQNSVDYYFLHYYFAGDSMSQGYRVWGISYGVSTLTGDLSVVPFFMDNQTAIAILGPTGAQDLLQG